LAGGSRRSAASDVRAPGLALNWNKLASELRVGLAAAIERERQEARDEASETPGDER
jgi:hypothetical protein